MTRFSTVRLILFAALLVLPAAFADTPPAPPTAPPADPAADPAIDLAKGVSERLSKDEAAWAEVSRELNKALEAYSPGLLNLEGEERTFKALRAYSAKLLESGKGIIKTHDRWRKASDTLAATLRRAPRVYGEVATLFRQYAKEAKFEANKEQYLAVAEAWEALAKQAERRTTAFSLDDGKTGFVEFLAESNTFLERFITALDSMPGTAGSAADQKEMLARLQKHMQRYEELRKSLKLLRDKVGQEATNKEVQKETSDARKKEALQTRTNAVGAFVDKYAVPLRAVRGDNAWVNVVHVSDLRPRQRVEVYRVCRDRVGWPSIAHAGTLRVVGEVRSTYHLERSYGEIDDECFLLRPQVKPSSLPAPEGDLQLLAKAP
ncbi:MAG: hypothetical protein U0797_08140 [Gemmataceae bacterium]